LLFSPPSGLGGPPSSIKAAIAGIAPARLGGSLRDQILASLESAFGRDRGHSGCRGVAAKAEVAALWRSLASFRFG
jgi:hypothetical protein